MDSDWRCRRGSHIGTGVQYQATLRKVGGGAELAAGTIENGEISGAIFDLSEVYGT